MFTGKFSELGRDIASALQSVSYSAGGLQITFIGRLYNKKELGLEHCTSDAHVVDEIYRSQGVSGFAKLDGSFTFILSTSDSLMVVRDHHGTNTQVYYNDSHFASSLSLLRQTPGCSSTPNYKALSSFLSMGYIATEGSSFEGIHKLGAGRMLLYTNGRLEVKPIYDTTSILPVQKSLDLESIAEEYGQLHSRAIKRRIADSRNVGILLSGGYDSGCNLAALRKVYDGDIRSYSIGFRGDDWTELPLAKCMSQTFGTIHHQYEIDGSEIADLPDIIRELGDPFVEGGLMVNYAVMRMIGENKPDVILGGDGSDQYFGTSGREVAMHYLTSKYGIKPLLVLLHSALNREMFDKNSTPYRIRFHLEKILNILQGDMFGFESFNLKQLLRDSDYMHDLEIQRSDNRSFEHLYTQHAYLSDIEKTINQVILFKASRMADMFGNTIAFPYMDIELYEFLKQLPVNFKCKGESALKIAKGESTAKFLLKYHYKPMLPTEITSKKKQGGFAPMPIFFKDRGQRNKIAEFIRDSSVVTEFLNRDAVDKFIRTYDIESQQAGNWFWYKQNKAIQYFNLLTLSIWWEQNVKNNQSISLK